MSSNGMRRIALIRHGEPAIPQNEPIFISRTDYELTDFGCYEAARTGRWLKENGFDGASVFCSPLKRCIQTAELICSETGFDKSDITVDERLIEISCGEWEGLTFKEVSEKYPEQFEARGRDLAGYRIPGGENFYDAGERFCNVLSDIREGDTGNIVIVTHAGMTRGLLVKEGLIKDDEMFTMPQGYAGMTVFTDNGTVQLEKIGYKPLYFLDEMTIRHYYEVCDLTDNIIRHMEAVAEFQDKLLDRLEQASLHYDREILRKAALLHDIKRKEKDHAKAGAKFLKVMGYPEVAELVADHHSPDAHPEILSDADILYFADKRVREDQIVSIEERFESSRHKCTSDEAIAIHTALYNRAKRIEDKIRSIINE